MLEETIRLITELLIAGGVAWNIYISHRGDGARKEIAKKIDVLTVQTNGVAEKLEAGNKAIGAAEARRDDKVEAEKSRHS